MGETMKRVFFSGGGKTEAEGKDFSPDVLGKEGFGLAEMTGIGLPVPASFTIGIPACEEYFQLGRRFSKGLELEVREALVKLEKCVGKKLGQADDPLLVSVHGVTAHVTPLICFIRTRTILNLGLNDQSVKGLAAKTGNPRFAYDCYLRLIKTFSTHVIGLDGKPMDEMFRELESQIGGETDSEIPAGKLKELCGQFKAFYKEKKGEEFPKDQMRQLLGAIKAVFNWW
jgi:pyruvate,orthophosphate dikinase